LRGKRREISGLLVGETSPLSVFGSLLVRVGSVTAVDVEPKLSPGCEVVGFKVGDAGGGGW